MEKSEAQLTQTVTTSATNTKAPLLAVVLQKIERNGTAVQEKRKATILGLEQEIQSPPTATATTGIVNGYHLPKPKRQKTEGEILRAEELKDARNAQAVRAQGYQLMEEGSMPGVIPSFMDISNPLIPVDSDPKNNYLQAGLLSGYYKTNSPPPSIDKTLSEAELTKLCTSRHALTKTVLCPIPARTGREGPTVSVEENYQLPLDIWSFGVEQTRVGFEDWCQLEITRRADEKKIRKSGIGKREQKEAEVKVGVKRKRVSMPEHPPDSWTFKRLRINTYVNKPSSTHENDVQHCLCKEDGEFKCASDDCLNRVVLIECPITCGEKCSNRRIQKHEWAPQLKRYMTENKGYGVKSLRALKKGDFILEYIGEVVTVEEFMERMRGIYANDTHHYCLQLDSKIVIDGHRSGGEGRFVNHSCEPNCQMQKWSVNGRSRMALYALRDIPAGEELSYDYNFSLYNETEGQPCYCGSVNCRGVIRGKSKMCRRKNVGLTKNGLTEGSNILFFKGRLGSNVKAKVLQRREIRLARRGNVFLVRNYERSHGPPSPDFSLKTVMGQGRGRGNVKTSKGGGIVKKFKSKDTLTEYERRQIAQEHWTKRENLNSVIEELITEIGDFSRDPVDLSYLLEKERKARKSTNRKSCKCQE